MMKSSPAMLVARILLGLIFLVAGWRKLMAVAGTAGYFAKLGLPMPEVLAWVAIVIELGGAVLLIVGWQTRFAALALALLTVIAAFAAHRFWEFDAAQQANQMNHFLKNLAIVGGMILLAATGPGSLSVDGRRRPS